MSGRNKSIVTTPQKNIIIIPSTSYNLQLMTALLKRTRCTYINPLTATFHLSSAASLNSEFGKISKWCIEEWVSGYRE